MPRTTFADVDSFEMETEQQYTTDSDSRTVTLEMGRAQTGVWLKVDGETVGHYSLIELAQELGHW